MKTICITLTALLLSALSLNAQNSNGLFTAVTLQNDGSGAGMKITPNAGFTSGKYTVSAGLQIQKESWHVSGTQLDIRRSLSNEQDCPLNLFMFASTQWGFNNVLSSNYAEIAERVYEKEIDRADLGYKTISQYAGVGLETSNSSRIIFYGMIGAGGYYSYDYISYDVIPESFRATIDKSDISVYFSCGLKFRNILKKRQSQLVSIPSPGSGKF